MTPDQADPAAIIPQLPSTIEEEADVLAGLMVIEGGFETIAGRLKAEHFEYPLFQRIFSAMSALVGAGSPVTPVTVMHAMATDDEYAKNGGGRFWAERTADPSIFYALGHVDHIIASARRRAILSHVVSIASAVAAPDGDINGALGAIDAMLAETSNVDDRTFTFDRAFERALHRIDAIGRGEIPPGVMVHGLDDWNEITGGMKPGEFILLGGRPSMGKTALSLSVAWRAAMAGHGVLYISREMHVDELMPRIVADMLHAQGGKASFDDIQKGQVSNDDKRLLRQIGVDLAGLPLIIVAPEGFGAEQLSPLIRRTRKTFEQQGKGLGLVVVDYLGLIDPPASKPNREQEVTAISRMMKQAANSNRVPIMVLSQLNRAVEQREDKLPMLNDLRESGSLEQDADQVIFVFREEYYLKRSEPDPSDVNKRLAWEERMRAASDRMDICLYERHYLWRRVKIAVPLLSNPTPGGYTIDANRDGINDSWEKLADATGRFGAALAFECASFGRFQIMGAHWKALGYESVLDFVWRLSRDETAHYEAFARFIETNGLAGALRRIDGSAVNARAFARGYNGSAYEAGKYHEKIAAAFRAEA